MRCTTRTQRVLLCRVFLLGIALVSVYLVGKSLTGIMISDCWQRTKNTFEENGVLIPIGVEVSDTQEGKSGQPKEQLQRQRQRMEGRQSQAERYCQHTGTKDGETDEQHSPTSCPLVSLTHPSMFCSIGKIGSTFWSRFYKVLDRNASSLLDSPFTVPVKVADEERCQSADNIGSLTASRRHVVKSMFVRDPFSRLFSAYVDKLLAPNPTFWTTWGIPAMLLEGSLEAKDVTCGHAVTFQQFVRLVNNRLHREDPHVISSVRMCDPCKMNYDVIGKMETFSEDLRYLTSVLNVTFDPRLSLATESKVDAILDSVESPFEWREDITKCISTQEMGRRIWRKLQIRGIISISRLSVGRRGPFHSVQHRLQQSGSGGRHQVHGQGPAGAAEKTSLHGGLSHSLHGRHPRLLAALRRRL
ncbi:hypothetical protein C0Q70_21158 [Pomacea canaliculata]|uniref:Carbohydrate sulfotransferase n=1 Tax=Pomacea canaliculata TaxID=400727 RepID=A0A2T7NBQ9_POMCA|nr:hypothetical protein C0Q70_21158 [Pomacea canaliculata]